MQIPVKEALRYLGASACDEALRCQVQQMAEAMQRTLVPRMVYREATILPTAEGIYLPEADLLLPGRMAATMLETCQRAVLLVCTLGVRFDAMLRTWQARDMAQAVVFDACGSAYVEAGCEAAEERIRQAHTGLYLTDRFSPGYGDLPLSVQPGLLHFTDAARGVGVTLTDSLLMNPTKSVSAIIGLSHQPQKARVRGCTHCAMAARCPLRKRGEACGIG